MADTEHPCSRQAEAERNENIYLPSSCSVICSSSCKNMNSNSSHTHFKLFDSSLGERIRWPSKTEVCCWYCCHRFETMQVCVPANYCSTGRYFEVFGVFCSWNCAKAHLQENYSSESSEQLMWMRIMAKRVFGTDLGDFHAAPPRIFLKMFGGHLDIEEFRRKSQVSTTVMLAPPLVSYPLVQRETRPSGAGTDDPAPSTQEDTLSTINPSMLAGKVVGLRRPHPSSRSRSLAGSAGTQHSVGLYQKFMQQKEGGSDAQGGHSSGSGDRERSKQKPSPPAAPSGKGTLASFIRSRTSG